MLCAAPRKVREIMLAAEELNMVSSGEYVFFNIELLNRSVSCLFLCTLPVRPSRRQSISRSVCAIVTAGANNAQ